MTFKNSVAIQDVARWAPIDRIHVETDSPYLAPVPHRGRPNRPSLVSVVGAGVAAAREEDVSDVAEATWRTAEQVYDLSLR